MRITRRRAVAVGVGLAGLALARPLSRAARRLVVCDGNSLTEGTGGASYPAELGRLLGPLWRVRNLGVGGQTTADLIARSVDTDRPAGGLLLAPDLIAWEVTNDLFFGSGVVEAVGRFADYCGGRRAAGFRVRCLTVLPRSEPGTPPGFDAARAEANARLRAGWPGWADGLVDVAADPELGPAGAELNPAWYADRVHLTGAGYRRVAGNVAAALTG